MRLRDCGAIALRYSFAFGKGHLSTFLSSLSMWGLILAITLLVTVLSVMNGFDKEMRERILALVPHITVHSHQPIADWQVLAERVREHPAVEQVAPFVQFDALVKHGREIETVRAIGLDASGQSAAALLSSISEQQRGAFATQSNGLLLGSGLAAQLKVAEGDQLTVIVPALGGAQVADAQFAALQLVGILETGTELDQQAALVPLALASDLANLTGGVNGLRVHTRDIFSAAGVSWELMDGLPPGYYTTHWMMTHGNLYAAIQLSRSLVTILLLSIIGVAAFNVVSSLVLVVFDKRGDIAILRTLGASPRAIALIFVLQGGIIGAVGASLGALGGAGLSALVPHLVAQLESLLGYQFLNTDVYPVSFVPVDLRLQDVLTVAGTAFGMCLLAACYPALRAARLAPAAVLQQD